MRPTVLLQSSVCPLIQSMTVINFWFKFVEGISGLYTAQLRWEGCSTLNKRKRRKRKRSNKGIAGVKNIFLNLLIGIDYIGIILCYIWISICFEFYSSVKNPETKKSRFLALT